MKLKEFTFDEPKIDNDCDKYHGIDRKVIIDGEEYEFSDETLEALVDFKRGEGTLVRNDEEFWKFLNDD